MEKEREPIKYVWVMDELFIKKIDFEMCSLAKREVSGTVDCVTLSQPKERASVEHQQLTNIHK